jgi:hypothetical protein
LPGKSKRERKPRRRHVSKRKRDLGYKRKRRNVSQGKNRSAKRLKRRHVLRRKRG